jgi:aspartate aminotransferase
VAVADFLRAPAELDAFAAEIRAGVEARLDALHDGLAALGARGLPVEASRPMGAIYLSARFMLNGRRTPEGATLGSNEDIRRYLLGAAGLALVPFQAFGVARDDGWFRLSVGAVSLGEIAAVLPRLETAIRAIG